jgi:hypothetical protein
VEQLVAFLKLGIYLPYTAADRITPKFLVEAMKTKIEEGYYYHSRLES